MSNIVLINLSPRQKGTSAVLAGMCADYLRGKGHNVEFFHLYPSLNHSDGLYRAIGEADTVVLSGPCYINTYPADTLALFEGLAARPELLHGQNLYAMVQGGMPYVHTHENALLCTELFAQKCGLRYRGGFVMGMGAMLNGQPLDKLPHAKRVIRQLNVLFGHISAGEASPRSVYEAAQFRLPGFLAGVMALWMNSTIDKDLHKHGIDPVQPNPYLQDAP